MGGLGDLHRDVGRQGAHAVEDGPVEHGGVAGGHEHDHGLAHRPPEPDHDGGEDTGARRGQHHANGGLPSAGAQGQRGGGEVLGHAGERVLGDREDDRDHREAHGDPHHQAIALVVDQVERRLQPEPEVAPEEPGLHRGPEPVGGEAPQQQQGDDEHHLHARPQPVAQASGDPVPEQHPGRPEEGHEDDHEQHRHHVALDSARQPQPRDEAHHHARQRGHDLDQGLDLGLEARVHELRGVERAHDGEGDGEEERVERALDGAKDEGNQAELGLEVVGGARGLPDVLGARVALVVDLAEQGTPRHLGVRVADVEAQQVAVRPGGDDAVALGGDEDRVDGLAEGGELEEGALRGDVAQHEGAVAARGDEALVPRGATDGLDGRPLTLEGVGLDEAQVLVLVAYPHAYPGGETALAAPHQERVGPERVLQGGDGLVGDVLDLGLPEFGAELPVVQVAFLRRSHQPLRAGEPRVGDLLAVGAEGLPLLLLRLVDANDCDLVVAQHRRRRLPALVLLIGDVAHGPLGGIHLEGAALPHLDLEVRQLLLFVAGPEAHLGECHLAVGGPRPDVVAGQAPRRRDHRGPGQGRKQELPGQRAVGQPEEDEAAIRKQLVQVHLVFVGPDREGLFPCVARHGRHVDRSSRSALGRAEQRNRLPEDEEEDEEDRDDDEKAAHGDGAGGEAVQHLHPGDALRRLLDALPDARGDGHALGGGSHGRFSGRASYSSLASSCLAISAESGRYPSLITTSCPSLLRISLTYSFTMGSSGFPGALLT